MKVTVEDDREFPDYQNTQVVTMARNVANEVGVDWETCEKIGHKLQEMIESADYLSDDVGRTWAVSFDPKKYTMDKSDVKVINKGVENHGTITNESWYGWMIVEVPSEYLNLNEWQNELGHILDLWAGNTGPGRAFRDIPHFTVDTYQRYRKDRTNILITQMGGLDV